MQCCSSPRTEAAAGLDTPTPHCDSSDRSGALARPSRCRTDGRVAGCWCRNTDPHLFDCRSFTAPLLLCRFAEVKVIFGKLDKNQVGTMAATRSDGGERRRRLELCHSNSAVRAAPTARLALVFVPASRSFDSVLSCPPASPRVVRQDNQIDLREWVSVLFDLFRFMSAAAFDKHCEELLALLHKMQPNAAAAATGQRAGAPQ